MADHVSNSKNLVKLCRVCGKILADNIYKGVSSGMNQKYIQQAFCHVCFSTMQNVEKINTVHSISQIIWQPHNADNYLTCNLAAAKAKGRCPTKKGQVLDVQGS